MAAAGEVLDTSSKYLILFSKFDSSGGVKFYKTYDLGLSGYQHLNAYGLIEYNKAYYIIGNVQMANYYVETFLAKLDSAGNLQFAKTYYNLPELYQTRGQGICVLPNSNLLISVGRTDDNINNWQAIYNTCFLEVDTAGNLVHQTCTTDNNTWVHYNLANTYDGKYLSCGSYFSLRQQGFDMAFQEYLVKWNTNFSPIWTVTVGDSGYDNSFSNFRQDGGSNIILCGSDENDINEVRGITGCLAKVDSAGNLLWYKQYMVPTGLDPDHSWNYFYDMALLPGGDILAIGSWQANLGNPFLFQQVGWMIRVHPDGCLDSAYCGIAEVDNPAPVTKPTSPLQVYPNPSNGVFAINALVELPSSTEIEIYDALGRKLHNQLLLPHITLLNLKHLPGGIYYYRVTSGSVVFCTGRFEIQK
jgi:hypothetical protein